MFKSIFLALELMLVLFIRLWLSITKHFDTALHKYVIIFHPIQRIRSKQKMILFPLPSMRRAKGSGQVEGMGKASLFIATP